jgi:hypothetical protein
VNGCVRQSLKKSERKKKLNGFFDRHSIQTRRNPFYLERDAGLDVRSSERSVTTTTLWGLKVRFGVRRPCVDLDLDLDLASVFVCVFV